VRYAWIDTHRDQYGVSRLCRVLQVSRSGYCQWRVRPPSARSQRRAAFDDEIARLHAQSRGSYGRPRLLKALAEKGMKTSAERVRRSLLQPRAAAGVSPRLACDHGLGASLARRAERIGTAL
jgi:putative transposase